MTTMTVTGDNITSKELKNCLSSILEQMYHGRGAILFGLLAEPKKVTRTQWTIQPSAMSFAELEGAALLVDMSVFISAHGGGPVHTNNGVFNFELTDSDFTMEEVNGYAAIRSALFFEHLPKTA